MATFAIFWSTYGRGKADFALRMEGSHANITPHMERRHLARDQQIVKIAISAK